MSIAQNLSLHQVPSETSSPLAAAQPGFWKKLGGAVWRLLEQNGRHRAEQAKKHGYHNYY
ncbi:MAG: hypothetical protein WBJ21_13475 [Burkholderiaceae bacterium]